LSRTSLEMSQDLP